MLLHDMRQLVREQHLPLTTLRMIRPLPKEDLLAGREGPRPERVRELVRLRIRVDGDLPEVDPKRVLQGFPDLRWQGVPAATALVQGGG
jgi:hypothetical protein